MDTDEATRPAEDGRSEKGSRREGNEFDMNLNKIYFIHCFFRHIKYRRFNKAKSRTNESAMNKAVTLYNKGMINRVWVFSGKEMQNIL